MGLKGNPQRIKTFAAQLRALPITLAAAVAEKAAPAMTELTTSAYDGGKTVYGDARPKAESGGNLDLEESGDTRAQVRFVRIGTIVRCSLGTLYAKYLIGKYKILPNGPVPAVWRAKLDAILAAEEGPTL